MPDHLRKTLTLNDALKITRRKAVSTMVKPVGSLCNLDCSYCYYLDKASLYDHHQPKMDFELLDEYIRQYIEANEVPEITFCWHGGEPLIAGIDYYRRAVAIQNKYRGSKKIINTLQTNGMLVNREWCDFFRSNDFLVGVSLDGPEEIHDKFRRDKRGGPTFDRVMESIEMMAGMGVEYNILCTVSSVSEGYGAGVYRFLRSVARFIQFLPVLEHVVRTRDTGKMRIVSPGTEGSEPAPWSVSAKGFGQFMIEVFNQWVANDVGNVFVQLFDSTLARWCGLDPGLCTMNETCGEALVVEHNGDVYSCDHFVYPGYKIGNIRTSSIRDMMNTPAQVAFGINKRNSLAGECLGCSYYFVCTGECPKHRFATTASGEKGLNSLCEGYKAFFTHVSPYMDFMREQISHQKPPAGIIPWARQRLKVSK
jgi:uncharacterized protein